MSDEKKDLELTQEQLDAVAGGGPGDIRLRSLEELESAPFFEEMKDLLRRFRNSRDLNNADQMHELVLHLGVIVRKNKYFMSEELSMEFIEKYLHLV
ncbi:MAG: hypothetical protein II772_04990 [Lachnospiraceae bacterium]|nr:hypothetical protein [Lachnospiraceae bacterium]